MDVNAEARGLMQARAAVLGSMRLLNIDGTNVAGLLIDKYNEL